MGNKRFAHFALALILLVSALCVLLRALKAALDDLDIRKDQLEVKGLGVALRVGRFEEYLVVIKAAHNVYQRVGLADGLKDLVALAGTDVHARNVDELYRRRGVLLRVVVVREPVKALVGNLRRADVGLCPCHRVCARLGFGAGEGVKQSGLADVGQTRYAKLHIYCISLKAI